MPALLLPEWEQPTDPAAPPSSPWPPPTEAQLGLVRHGRANNRSHWIVRAPSSLLFAEGQQPQRYSEQDQGIQENREPSNRIMRDDGRPTGDNAGAPLEVFRAVEVVVTSEPNPSGNNDWLPFTSTVVTAQRVIMEVNDKQDQTENVGPSAPPQEDSVVETLVLFSVEQSFLLTLCLRSACFFCRSS